jgi:NodT family efflux transporter outer membrane factor (OMF) lipoprotein
VPAQWSSPAEGGETNAPLPNAAWWKQFGEPELDALIARAAQSNLTVRLAEARIREARAARTFARGGLWPTLDANASYLRERISGTGFPPLPAGTPTEFNLYQADFDSRWELDIFGGTRRAIEAARAELEAGEFARRDVLVSLSGEVARNFIESRGLQRRLAIARENIAAQSNVVELTSSRYRSGLSSDLDVQEAVALLATTQSQVPALETVYSQTTHRLAVLLGESPGSLKEESGSSDRIPPPPPEVPIGLPADLLRRRPDIARAERELAAATARIGVAVSDLFPKFSLTGQLGLQSLSASDWFTAGSRFWTAGPTVQWRIFDAGRIRANIQIQNARQEQALLNYEQTILNAMEEVENGLTAYAKEQIRYQSLVRAVAANREALRLANQLYQNGLADFLRVLESQRNLYQAEDALIQSQTAVSVNLVALYKALGGGWEVQQQNAAK